MFSLLADLQKERGFPHPSRKKKLLKFKRESTRSGQKQKYCSPVSCARTSQRSAGTC
jgi:hypothetical protein